MDGWSQIKVHTDEWEQVHTTQSSLAVTHPSTNHARRYLTSVAESPSKHWSPQYMDDKIYSVTHFFTDGKRMQMVNEW